MKLQLLAAFAMVMSLAACDNQKQDQHKAAGTEQKAETKAAEAPKADEHKAGEHKADEHKAAEAPKS
jgi:hypothetical protein